MEKIGKSANDPGGTIQVDMAAIPTSVPPLKNASPLSDDSCPSTHEEMSSPWKSISKTGHMARSIPGDRPTRPAAAITTITSLSNRPSETTSSPKDSEVTRPSLHHRTSSISAGNSGKSHAQHMESPASFKDLSGRRPPPLTANPAGITDPPRFNAQRTEAGGITHTNSKTWVRDDLIEREKWGRIFQKMWEMHFIPNPQASVIGSPFVPTTFKEWLAHRVAFQDYQVAKETRRIAANEAPYAPRYANPPHPGPKPVTKLALGEKLPFDGRSAVLGQPTIWTPSSEPTANRPVAPWPSVEEMREEGDQRHTSQKGRFLALPRLPGNDTVAWKHKYLLPPQPLDAVWRLEDIFESVQEAENKARAVDDRIEEETARILTTEASKQYFEEQMVQGLANGLHEENAEIAAEISTLANAEAAARNIVTEALENETAAENEKMEGMLGKDLMDALDCKEED